jgi:hypothetical protein
VHTDWPGEHGHVRYGEGIHVGYRYYGTYEVPVAFLFGRGLSYTTFDRSDVSATVAEAGDISVRVTVTNTGNSVRSPLTLGHTLLEWLGDRRSGSLVRAAFGIKDNPHAARRRRSVKLVGVTTMGAYFGMGLDKESIDAILEQIVGAVVPPTSAGFTLVD